MRLAKIGAGKSILSVRAYMKSNFRVYCETMWQLETKERLVNSAYFSTECQRLADLTHCNNLYRVTTKLLVTNGENIALSQYKPATRFADVCISCSP